MSAGEDVPVDRSTAFAFVPSDDEVVEDDNMGDEWLLLWG